LEIMISAKKARKEARKGDPSDVLKYIDKMVREAVSRKELSVKISLKGFGAVGYFDMRELEQKGYRLDWDEDETWIELDWNI
jgi:hypothetical protein